MTSNTTVLSVSRVSSKETAVSFQVILIEYPKHENTFAPFDATLNAKDRKRVCSLYELSSSPSQVRVTSQVRVRKVPFLPFSFSFCFGFVSIKGCDCDSCFHNDVPTDVRSIKHERDIVVNAIARIHCLVAN